MDTQPMSAPSPPPEPDAAPAGGGSTWISDAIVAKLAAMAALEVEGVHSLRREGRGFGRPAKETDEAAVTVREGEAAIELRLVVRDGVRIPDVVDAVRIRVVQRVEEATGMRVRSVDIGVVDLVPEAAESPDRGEEADEAEEGDDGTDGDR